MNKKRLGRILIILLVTLQPLIIGAKFFDLQLRNVDKPLVNMKMLVNGNSLVAEAEELSQEEGEETKPDEPAPTVTAIRDTKKEITVKVSGSLVYVNNQLVAGKPFEKAFNDAYSKDMSVTVIDDYADYKAMKSVIDSLNEMGIFFSTKETR